MVALYSNEHITPYGTGAGEPRESPVLSRVLWWWLPMDFLFGDDEWNSEEEFEHEDDLLKVVNLRVAQAIRTWASEEEAKD